MNRPHNARLAVACALLALTLPWATAARARCSVTFVEMPVKMVGHRAIATVGINGVDVPLLVDTGAFFSVLPEATAAQLKLPLQRLPYGFKVSGITGDMEQPRMTRAHVTLLGGEIPASFIVGGNEIDQGARGILGRNILAAVDTEFDLAHGVIRFVSPSDECRNSNMAYWAGDTPVSQVDLISDTRRQTPAISALVKVNGHATAALFDTGASTLLSLRAAHQAGVKDADMQEDAGIAGIGQGRARSWTASFDSVSLGGETVSNNRLDVGDFELEQADMLIGIDFFLSHRLYISPSRATMFFTYNGGPVFARNTSEPATQAAQDADTPGAAALARRGAASMARGDYAGALVYLDRAHAQAPGDAATLLLRAETLVQLERDPAAEADLDETLRLEPTNTRALMFRASLRRNHGQADLAAADLAALNRTLPTQANERLQMATLYNEIHQHDAAMVQYTVWIDAHPHDLRLSLAYDGRCWSRVALNHDLDAAVRDCDKALDLDEKDAPTREARGWLALRQGRLEDARTEFDKGLALAPGGTALLYGRGITRTRQGDSAGGQADFAAARKANSGIDAYIKANGLPTAPDAK